MYDLIDRYHYRRWQVGYLIYLTIDWWPIFDFIASISSIFNGFIIIYIALFKNVSFFMFALVMSVAYNYFSAIKNL